MEREYKAMRLLKRCEFWSFAIAGLALVWWIGELWSAFNA